MTKLQKQRAARLVMVRRIIEEGRTLPGIAAANLKEAIELEAAKPMRGGDRELGADSLFGDGMKQGALF